ncbi:50S ribosomal protein L18-like isoform X2 [Zingiber officinale]|uniref:50S ribosomal protein L18-like isoform X2 n=1 Tax=Zingiber officinale TaxID=94328 RepID=UPI001C4AD598|nr:50S ribosomal protein L18-like isoform X2 [Zingiber officinale]
MSALVLPSSLSRGSASTLLEGHRLAFPIRHVPRRQFFRIDARNNAREESAKIRNRRMQRKYNGSARKPRLSVFCSNKQLYAMLVDDQNKKTLFYGSTLQKSIRGNPPCTSAVRSCSEGGRRADRSVQESEHI